MYNTTGLLLAAMISDKRKLSAMALTYTVQPGDSLWKIAVKFQVGLSEIIAANPQISNPALIFPNQVINIPQEDQQALSLEEQVVKLVNQERAQRGLSPLKNNWEVARVARYKSKDMYENNYFAHTSPIFGTPFEMLKKFGISFNTAAENIAKGQKTAQNVMNSWMNSTGHRENILNAKFTEIGVGFYMGGTTPFWTQLFIG